MWRTNRPIPNIGQDAPLGWALGRQNFPLGVKFLVKQVALVVSCESDQHFIVHMEKIFGDLQATNVSQKSTSAMLPQSTSTFSPVHSLVIARFEPLHFSRMCLDPTSAISMRALLINDSAKDPTLKPLSNATIAILSSRSCTLTATLLNLIRKSSKDSLRFFQT
ncbi:hypothetical protein VNO78_33535 [Psophocarpus tetragonolobus]|uniref:Uncharacterized protein n=1 Tax=Psophocarpus tetragonolobus TaxID=3891 RepID=A0AAN9NY81_PSOTE